MMSDSRGSIAAADSTGALTTLFNVFRVGSLRGSPPAPAAAVRPASRQSLCPQPARLLGAKPGGGRAVTLENGQKPLCPAGPSRQVPAASRSV